MVMEKIREEDLSAMVDSLASAFEVFETIEQAETLDEARALARAQVRELRNWKR
jgi:hypothetical protein